MRVKIGIVYDDSVGALIYESVSLRHEVRTMATYEEIDAHALKQVKARRYKEMAKDVHPHG